MKDAVTTIACMILLAVALLAMWSCTIVQREAIKDILDRIPTPRPTVGPTPTPVPPTPTPAPQWATQADLAAFYGLPMRNGGVDMAGASEATVQGFFTAWCARHADRPVILYHEQGNIEHWCWR